MSSQRAATDDHSRRLLYYSPLSAGGLADYARAQAEALAKTGVEVVFLTSRNNELLPGSCQVRRELWAPDDGRGFRSPLLRKCRLAGALISQFRSLAGAIDAGNFAKVLMASYAEYLSPFWAGPLRRQSQRGVTIGAVIHDPVRDFVLGPLWWHRRSVTAAYSVLREAFVHEAIELDTAGPMPRLRTTVIPHGPYDFSPPQRSRAEVRAELDIPAGAKVLLAFGHVRDGKNLDLAIKALAKTPQVYLVVAGKVSSSTQKPIEYYRALADDSGVAGRCRWLIEFVPSARVGDLFDACDAVLLTYDASFRSASGVLNAAVAYRRPCIASAGQGNLRSMVQKYNLGLFVEPDNCPAIESGICHWLGGIPEPQWDAYARDNSWERNAEIVHGRMWEKR